MRKYEYIQLFSTSLENDLEKYWYLWRDKRAKVINVQREFGMTVETLESYSYYKYTIRGGGIDMRSRQLSEIRTICRLLGITTLHGSNKKKLSVEQLDKAKDYA